GSTVLEPVPEGVRFITETKAKPSLITSATQENAMEQESERRKQPETSSDMTPGREASSVTPSTSTNATASKRAYYGAKNITQKGRFTVIAGAGTIPGPAVRGESAGAPKPSK